MKRKHLLSFVFVGAAMLIGSQNLFTNIVQPPGGYTGAPGEQTCATAGCHAGTLNTNSSVVNLTSSGLTNSIAPSTLYNLVLNVAFVGNGSPRYGFSITAIDAAGNPRGTFAISNPSSTSLQTGANNKQYVGHLNATSNPAFTFKWTSPADVSAPIFFYVAANHANADSTSNGDVIHLRTFRANSSGLAPFTVTGIQNIDALSDKSISVFPNPVSDRLNLSFNLAQGNDVKAAIFNLNGQLVKPLFEEALSSGTHDRSYNVAGELSTGIYLVKMTVDGADYFKKIVVE
ncbi:hypothetical protein BH09BAC1_BH09BAC1_22220 [soil metagenome]